VSEETSTSRRNPVAVFFGWLLLAVGVLIAGTAGLCTLAVLGSTFPHAAPAEFIGMAVMALIFGGVPASVGVGLFFIGKMLLRKR
jgi:hypothetical protein